MRTLKNVFQDIAKKRETTISGLSSLLGNKNAQVLYKQILSGSFSLKLIRKMIDDLSLSDDEILEIVKTIPESEIVEKQIQDETGE